MLLNESFGGTISLPYLIIIFSIVLNIGLGYHIFKLQKEKIKEKQNKLDKPDEKFKNKEIDLNKASTAKKFLDEIIKDKFDYFMISKILPIYNTGKKLEKKEVKDLKEAFNIEVSILLNKDVKNEFLKYFNKDGIKIYIDHKFLYYLNKLDKAFYKPNEKDDIQLYTQ